MTRPRVLLAALTITLTLAGIAHARPTQVQPVAAPQSLLRARQACPNGASPVTCRAALRRAYAAVSWQQKARRDDARRSGTYGVQHALRLASALYGVPLAQLEAVGSCESHLQATSKNRTSTAAGVFQFLDSTWARAGVPGFSPFDPYASALAAARLVVKDGSWREWQCRP